MFMGIMYIIHIHDVHMLEYTNFYHSINFDKAKIYKIVLFIQFFVKLKEQLNEFSKYHVHEK